MDDDDDRLGGRLPLLAPARLDDEQRVLYDRFQAKQVPWAEASGFKVQRSDGAMIGPFNALLRTPAISLPFLKWGSAQSKASGLSEEIRQVVILTVGAHWNCAYEQYAHVAVARQEGLSPATIEAIAAHRTPDGVTAAARAAYALVDVLLREHRVPDEVYAKAIAELDVDGVVATLQLAGQYGVVCGILNTFDVPVPE